MVVGCWEIRGKKTALYVNLNLSQIFFNFFNRKVRKGLRKVRKVKNLWIRGKKTALFVNLNLFQQKKEFIWLIV